MTPPALSPDETPPDGPRKPGATAARVAALGALAVAGVTLSALGLGRLARPDWVMARYMEAAAAVTAHPVTAAAAFVAFYAGGAAASLPGVLWLSIMAGLIFGWAPGAALAWLGVWMGSAAAFVLARGAAGAALRDRLSHLAPWFARDPGFSILTLRLLPFPYFLVNLAAGAFGAPVRVFLLASAVGFAPQAIAYAGLGAGAREAVMRGEISIAAVTANPALLAGFAGLAALSLAATLLRRRRANGPESLEGR